jgi:integrase
MAQVTKRTWRSGPRKVKRVAYGYTFQDKDGNQVRQSDASWTREDAEQAMAARMLNISTPKADDVHVVTFKQMTERYLLEKEAAKKKNIKADKHIIARLLAAFGPDTPLTEITAPKISAYRLERLTIISPKSKALLGPGTINRELQVLRGLLRMAASEDYGYLVKAPTVKMEKEPEGRLRFLTQDEAARLLDECRRAAEHPVSTNRSPRLHALVTVALHTGMRRGELAGLVWDRVDFSRGVLRALVDRDDGAICSLGARAAARRRVGPGPSFQHNVNTSAGARHAGARNHRIGLMSARRVHPSSR